MGSKDVTHFRVKVRHLFPPDEPIIPPLLRLMAATNDLLTLQKLWVYTQTRVGESESEGEIIRAEILCLFRFQCGVVYEAGRAFQHFRRVLTREDVEPIRETMPNDAIVAFEALSNIFPRDFENTTQHGQTLHDLRNSVFHYAPPGEFCNALLAHDEVGSFIHGEMFACSRYLLADNLQVQIIMRPLGVDKGDGFRELGRLTVYVGEYLNKLVNGVIAVYLQRYPDAVIEEVEDIVDSERLWRIPSMVRWDMEGKRGAL